MKYSLRQLEVFVAVARHNSVSQAAGVLAMSQSAASTALAELERQFATRLFDRSGKRLQLNDLGQILLPRAMDILDRAREVEHVLEGASGIGPLRIGATLTIGNYLAALLIGDFMRRNPGSHIHLEVSNTRHVIERVMGFDLDLGMVEGEYQHPDLEMTPWIGDELTVFAAPEHPLAHRDTVTLADLVDAVWIVREPGSGTRQTFERGLHEILPRLNILLELEHTEAIKRAVESGLGIGCISRMALRDAFKRGTLVPIHVPALDLRRNFYFVLHRQKYVTAGIAKFLDLCRAVTANAEASDEIVLPWREGAH
jgi:DNA-binding transcriptional LysR family regulator